MISFNPRHSGIGINTIRYAIFSPRQSSQSYSVTRYNHFPKIKTDATVIASVFSL